MSRRWWPAALAVVGAMLVAGCGGGGTADPQAAAGTRPVTHELGSVEVPTRPQNVVAVDELAGLAALSHGITPRVVYTSAGDEGAQAVLREAGVELAPVQVAELPPTEELVRRAPDLVIGTGAQGAIGTSYADVSKVAPTIVLPVSGEWRQMTTKVGELLGNPENAARQVTAVEARLRQAAGASNGRTLSLLGNSFGTNNFTMPQNAPISALIREAGFTRPAPQQQTVEGYSIVLSAEQLSEHGGDLVVVPAGTFYDADALLAIPTAKAFAPKASRPLAEAWFGTTPFAFFVSAGDLRTLATGQGTLSDAAAVPQLWREFTAESAA
ncbi:ABC transporter substrate-binding protein [Pseudonocardia endophytica]|uniref:Iron complex transport system substrate-binding protein n=1 Tax=Pseudonocardia endophytica TaxID=401976 RepID=A0A4R1HR28_PSEEN|nr:ABC transporter substrate-binding protein [Pseudonocardia endophytica]TCK24598.1 iron complex transport system substrate-binding protein [Pseudonocardia endophytica]